MDNQSMHAHLMEMWPEECLRSETPPWGKETAGPLRPNVIWIISDQQRAMSLACNGDPSARTPHLDRMARYGVNFTQAVSANPICCPFRGSMLTGLQHHRCVPGHQYGLNEEQPTIANVFNEAGYDTAYIGKWHLDGCRSNAVLHYVPPHRRGGFQKWMGYENNNAQWNTWIHGNLFGKEEKRRVPGYETDGLTDLFIEYLNGRKGNEQPFFAVLSVQPPHPPYMAPAENLDHFRARDLELRPNVPAAPRYQQDARKNLAYYYAMIENLDQNIGRILKTLADCEMDLNTHILFFSDHGDMMGSHGLWGKVMPYEESIRIPFLISGGAPCYFGHNIGNVNALLTEVDIAPTTLGLCGLPIPAWMEGRDYSHYRLANRPRPQSPEPDSAYIKAITPHDGSYKPWRGIVTKDGYKYVCFENEPWMLFNLNQDPFEQANLVHQLPYLPLCHRLQARLQQWIQETGDIFQLPVLPPLAQGQETSLAGITLCLSTPEHDSYDYQYALSCLEELGACITEKIEDAQLFITFDFLYRMAPEHENCLAQLARARTAGIPILALCLCEIADIAQYFKDEGLPFARLEKREIAGAVCKLLQK